MPEITDQEFDELIDEIDRTATRLVVLQRKFRKLTGKERIPKIKEVNTNDGD